MRRWIFTVFCLMCLSACAANYYGHSEAEWMRMSDAERAKAKADYQPLLDERERQRGNQPAEDAQDKVVRQGLGIDRPQPPTSPF
ncbi:MAG: hypothetical protein JSW10_09365 [Pseudomonadota bacterium]|nr:MAG: hypothetical protein JSW10_09365 [Pseudomonadota bacterium]